MSSGDKTFQAQPKIPAAVLTISDSCSRGERADISGPAVADSLKEHQFEVVASQIVADDQQAIAQAMRAMAEKAKLIVTTGGTGIAARDVTPEATRTVCNRLLEGIPERMRFEGSKKTKFAALSRGLCGIFQQSLILNVPGNPKGAVESLEAVIDILPHALQLLSGNTHHE